MNKNVHAGMVLNNVKMKNMSVYSTILKNETATLYFLKNLL